ncbi:MAG TPA: 4-alpha-glucanotransferase [Paludibaculum sp.]|jgi:4-alpha-glucanotransferase
MRFARQSGVLLHPTSLPGGHGVGDLGPEAFAFVDFLVAAKQTLWQVLPLGPTGYGDSPYQCFSAFAGNPLLVSLELLAQEGWLDEASLRGVEFVEGRASYEAAQAFKLPLLARAAANFAARATAARRAEFVDFCTLEGPWLDNFALFMTAKRLYNDVAWYEWDAPHRDREPAAMERLRETEAAQIHAVKFAQWCFFRQWNALRAACHARGIQLMGDIPIYAAGDSADVWCARNLWYLSETGAPTLVAGVPPDYFSATGQLWGNPIYRWDVMESHGFEWWINRFRATFQLFDMVRVDHFRGFHAFWQVPGGETTAVNGKWVPGPGARLFEAVEAALGRLPIVAENLGVITPEVESIRNRFEFPGMAILQFAFGADPQAPDFKPHNYPREVVAYTGTHDNDTTMGWWTSAGAGDSTRTADDIRTERRRTLAYLGMENADDLHWRFIRALMGSVANTVVFPAQDLLGLGTEARMNMPSTLGTNWLWRMKRGALTPEMAARLHELAMLYDR